MGKIRLRDLARMIGLPEQDLKFKLKSIGVRLDGDDAEIDSDIIQAILQGKRLPQPREVIIRDDQPEATKTRTAPTPRRPLGRPTPFRPARRTPIQRVESVHREPAQPKQPESAPAEAAQPEKVASVPTEQASPEKKPKSPAPAAPRQKVAAGPKPSPGARPGSRPGTRPGARPAGRPTNRPGARPSRPPSRPGAPANRPQYTRPGAPRRPNRPGAVRPAARRPIPSIGQPSRRPPHRPATPASQSSPPSPPQAPLTQRGQRRQQRREEVPQEAAQLKFKANRPDGEMTVTAGMTVREFAEKLGVKTKDLIKAMMSRGFMVTINHVLDPETALSLAEDFGVKAREVSFEEEAQLQRETSDDSEEATGTRTERSPVVTVMGHVDHGKTTLLDAIRKTKVAAGEAGGITQHIGAYGVEVGDRNVVFLDTPGHEAFTLMRARGAKVTDIVVLVVAADDGVMPQTKEAIEHARAADVPIIVAINKIDKANANLDRVLKELADNDLMVEAWGGDTVSVKISALKGEGIDELLELILLTAELLELEASPELPAQGVVLEARKEVGRGMVCTMLIQDGTLRKGDAFVAGSCWGRVRSMSDDSGNRIREAGPATPVEVTGASTLPNAGDVIQVFEDESKARNISEFRQHEEKQKELAPMATKVSLDELFSQLGTDEVKELPLVVKADVQGSVEVLKEALERVSTDKVKIKVISSGVGAISTNNVLLASASNAIIVAFNVRPERNAAVLADKEQVEIRMHTVIYELIDELKRAMTGLLEPTFKEVHAGTAEVREIFKVPRVGVIAGCHIVDGTVARNSSVRLLRDKVVVFEGKIGSLRRFKEDASEVRSGFDCGIGLEGFQDVKPGDEIESFRREEVAQAL